MAQETCVGKGGKGGIRWNSPEREGAACSKEKSFPSRREERASRFVERTIVRNSRYGATRKVGDFLAKKKLRGKEIGIKTKEARRGSRRAGIGRKFPTERGSLLSFETAANRKLTERPRSRLGGKGGRKSKAIKRSEGKKRKGGMGDSALGLTEEKNE